MILVSCAQPPQGAMIGTAAPAVTARVNQLSALENRARNGDNRATLILAVIDLKGGNIVAAAKWMHMAADRGYPPAEAGLAHLYTIGLGVPQDYSLALKYARMAAERNDSSGLNNLGWLYERGLGIPADPVQGANYYRRSAMQGDAVAQGNLGRCYQQGIGVPVDHELAYFWDTLATSKLTGPKLVTPAKQRDAMLATLPADVVTRLQAAAADWKPGTEPPRGHPIHPASIGAQSTR